MIKGHKHSEESRMKMSASLKGRISPMAGKHLSDETKQKLREYNLSHNVKPPVFTGHTEATKKKMSETRKDKKYWSHLPNMKGKIMGEEQKRKIGLANSISLRGEKCIWWKGGITNSPYTIDWTMTLKRSIRERDHYQCQLCGKEQEDKALSVHHIDYDKYNCDPKNLIALCVSCHAKTNHHREKWIEYFKTI